MPRSHVPLHSRQPRDFRPGRSPSLTLPRSEPSLSTSSCCNWVQDLFPGILDLWINPGILDPRINPGILDPWINPCLCVCVCVHVLRVCACVSVHEGIQAGVCAQVQVPLHPDMIHLLLVVYVLTQSKLMESS